MSATRGEQLVKRLWFRRLRRAAPDLPRDLQAKIEAARLAGVWLGSDRSHEPDAPASCAPPIAAAGIAAPMTGCVRERYAEPGEWVREGEVLLRLARTCAPTLNSEG
jgi:biotin carboxyl carrier protein